MIRSGLAAATAVAAILVGYPCFTSTPAAARETVAISGYSPGTIVVRTSQRALYLVVDQGHALRYPVGVGRAGKQWSGTAYINGKYLNPAWSPPADVRRDKPFLPAVIPGGSPKNPMGSLSGVAQQDLDRPCHAAMFGEFFLELLFLVQAGVVAVEGEQFVVFAQFDDAAAV